MSAELLTAAQMRAIETAAIESGQVTGLELMERAGRGVVEAIFEEWPELAQAPHKAVVLCGPGNNGGDGFVVARLLHDRGWQVEAFLYGDPEKLPPDAKANHDRWAEAGRVDTEPPLSAEGLTADLFVDAVFGTGLTRPFDEIFLLHDISAICEKDEANAPHLVAIDMPTGIHTDSGHGLVAWVEVQLTVSFHRMKRGQTLADGRTACGKVVVKDIGL